MTTDRLRLNLLFEALGDEDVDRVRPNLRERRWRAGDIILVEDDAVESLLLIASGRVKVSSRMPSGDEVVLAILHEGDFVGELELIDGRPRASSVVALDETLTYELPREHFDRLLHTHPSIAQRLLHVASVRLRALTQQYIRHMDRVGMIHAAEVGKLHRLTEAAKTVNSTLDLDRLLQIILDTALEIGTAERGTLYIVDDAKQELWSKVLRGDTLVEIRLPMGRGIAGHVAATGESLRIDDAYLDPRFNPEFDVRSGFRTRSILCLPIRNKDNRIIGVLQLLNKRSGIFTGEDEELMAALSVHSAIALENARLYAMERQSIMLEKELSSARAVQMSLLPHGAPSVPGYEIFGRTEPAQWVGGDYFDFIDLSDNKVALCLGDVTGKGLPAALLMANIQAILRSQMMGGATPRRIMYRTNKLLRQSITEGKFVTLFYSILDAEKHWLVFTNAGHENPYLVKREGTVTRLVTGGTVLGILDDLFYEEEAVPLDPGDVIIVFSDGVTEAINSSEEMYGQQRLEECLMVNRHLPAEQLAGAVEASVKTFAGPVPMRDDLTLLVIRRTI